MNDCLNCLIYLASIGLALFLFGRILLKEWFHDERFPFRSFSFEKGGSIYCALGVRKWKDSFPDMSVIVPFLMPSKKLPKTRSATQLRLMIQETCVAEWTHVLLCIMGFGCVLIWKRVGGWVLAILYALGNLPYVIIQRYNRPKLIRLLRKIETKESRQMYNKDWGCNLVGAKE